MRELASIQEVINIEPIEGADAIELLTILGWAVVAKKGEFAIGDKVVYCEIDSILPQDREEFKFLENRGWRIKTIKLRGQVSQGICFPLSILEPGDWQVGDDVTEVLGVVKYEPKIHASLSGLVKGNFPCYISKTDETRIQSKPRLIEEFKGEHCYISVKVDGTSGTFANFEGDLNVCSRNLSLKENEDNAYWKMYYKYNMFEIFEKNPNFAIQGEVAGPGIQKNLLKLDEVELFVFNVYDIGAARHLDYAEMSDFCYYAGLQMVPIQESDIVFDFTLPELIELAKGRYESGKHREGIVIRPLVGRYSKALRSRASFKVINNDYLLKVED